MRPLVLTVTIVVLLAGPAISGQGANLEVASIREVPKTGGAIPLGEIEFQPGRLRVVNSTVEQMVAWAHGLMSPRVWERLIVGWPDSIFKETGFDVAANLTTADSLSIDEQRRIVLHLLASRFGFKAHREPRPMEVFTLTLVKEGMLGPNLQRVDFNCFEMAPADRPRDKDGSPLCRRFADMEQIVARLNVVAADRVIVDATGLKGYFVWNFGFGGDLSFETAVREQLGLRATAGVQPVDVVVIDRVQMPTPN